MSFVLDASVTMAWILPDEGTTEITELFERLLTEGAVVPSLWKLEVANTLLMAERRGRLDTKFRQAALTDLEIMPIRIDAETALYAWHTTLDLAAQYRLSIYDAAYLELAVREKMALATLDDELSKAAQAANVTLIKVRR